MGVNSSCPLVCSLWMINHWATDTDISEPHQQTHDEERNTLININVTKKTFATTVGGHLSQTMYRLSNFKEEL